MADRRADWERRRRRRERYEDEDERGGPWEREPSPEELRWREEERRFGPRPGWNRRRGDYWEGRRAAYTGWGYRDEERPHRARRYADEDRFVDTDVMRRGEEEPWFEGEAGEWRRPEPEHPVERAFTARPREPATVHDELVQMSAYRVTQGPHAGKGPRGYQRDWGRVRDDVCDLLERDGEIDASDIDVEVDEGIVTLRGTVADRHQKRRAEQLIDSIPQVRDVHNELRLKGTRERPETREQPEQTEPTDNGSDWGTRP